MGVEQRTLLRQVRGRQRGSRGDSSPPPSLPSHPSLLRRHRRWYIGEGGI